MGPAVSSSLLESIANVASSDPERVAFVHPERPSLSYAELASAIDAFADDLASRGIAAHATVGLAHPDGAEMALAFLGIGAQAACAPLNPNFTEPEFEFEIDDLGLVALVVGVGEFELPRAVAAAERKGIAILRMAPGSDSTPAGVVTLVGPTVGPSVTRTPGDPEHVALVLHTSGTTARPKIVPLRHRNVAASAHAVATSLELTASDRGCAVMPLFHIHGLIAGLSASLTVGASIICTPGFSAPDMLRWLCEFDATWYTAVPTMHQSLLERVRRNPSERDGIDVRLVRSSSASLPPSVMADLEACFDAPVIEAYGMTEAAHQMTSNPLPPAGRIPGSVGIPAGPEVAVMDEMGTLLGDGEVGEVVIKGSNVMSGYQDNAEATAAAFTNGWFRTGDQGRFADGYLVLTGRLKELINRGGESLSPREIDEVLLTHESVAQVVTFAVPDARLGEQVAAAIVPATGFALDELTLREFVASQLTAAKVPRRIVAVDALPKGPSGKLQRIGLAERLGLADLDGRADQTGSTHQAPASASETFLAEMWAAALGIDDIGVHDHFLDLGGDSLAATRLLTQVQAEIDVEISMLAFFDAPTIAEQAQLVEKLLLDAEGL